MIHATVAQMPKDTATEGNRAQTEDKDTERKERQAGDTQLEEENVTNAAQEYDLDRLVLHVGKGDNLTHAVRGYGYTAPDDMVELPAHNPEHSITRYWHRIRKQYAKKQ